MKLILILLILCLITALRMAFARSFLPFDIITTKSLKGLLAILIIVHHLSISYPPLHEFRDIGISIVAIFFFVSGYGLMTSLQRKGFHYLHNFLQKRVLYIFIPFLIATVVWLIMRLLWLGHSIDVILDGCKIGNPILPTSWFVYTIVLYYLAFYYIYKLTANFVRGFFLMLVFSSLYITLITLLDWSWTWWISAIGFNIGMLISIIVNDESLARKLNRQSISLLFVWGGVIINALTILFVFLTLYEPIRPLRYYIYSTMIPVAVFTGFRIANMKFMNWFGGISYHIYLVQGPIAYNIHYFTDNIIVAVIFAVVISLLFAMLLKFVSDTVYSILPLHPTRCPDVSL